MKILCIDKLEFDNLSSMILTSPYMHKKYKKESAMDFILSLAPV